jgi:hypothetical protein
LRSLSVVGSAAQQAPEPDRTAADRPGATSASRRAGAAEAPAAPGPALDRDAAERVLRRAIELVDDADPSDSGISLRALVEAAEELGIDPDGVHRAAAEEQLGLLAGEESRADRLVGPAVVTATRIVPGSPEEVLDRADTWLRRARTLRRVRRAPGRADYKRRTDPIASVQRAVRSASGAEELTRVQRLRVLTVPAGESRTLVALVVDAHRSRSAATAGGVTVAATGVATAGATAMTWVPWAWLGVPVAAAGGVAVMAARKGWVEGLDDELEALADLIATGGTPTSAFDGWAERLLASGRLPGTGRRVRSEA